MDNEAFLKAAKELAEVRGITVDEIYADIEAGLNAAYKKNYGGATNSKVILDKDTGKIKVVSYKVVVDEINMEEEN